MAHIIELGDNGAEVDDKLANMVLDLRAQPGGLEDANPLVDLGKEEGVTVRIREFP
jgi:filamentous hemagglutinin